jgi:hypothetical protein
VAFLLGACEAAAGCPAAAAAVQLPVFFDFDSRT